MTDKFCAIRHCVIVRANKINCPKFLCQFYRSADIAKPCARGTKRLQQISTSQTITWAAASGVEQRKYYFFKQKTFIYERKNNKIGRP